MNILDDFLAFEFLRTFAYNVFTVGACSTNRVRNRQCLNVINWKHVTFLLSKYEQILKQYFLPICIHYLKNI